MMHNHSLQFTSRSEPKLKADEVPQPGTSSVGAIGTVVMKQNPYKNRFQWLAAVLLGVLGTAMLQAAAPLPVVQYTFIAGPEGFAMTGGKGTVTFKQQNPLTGRGSLRLELAADGSELKTASPEFAVQPWAIYRVRLRQQTDLGAQLDPQAELLANGKWQAIRLIKASDGGWKFGTFPETQKARLLLTLTVPGKALGRTAIIEEISVAAAGTIQREDGINLYWDGSFEKREGTVPGEFGFWVKDPEKTEMSQDNPHSGRWCFKITGSGTYPVLPTVPVQPERFYVIRFWARGTGTIYPGMHKLAPSDWGAMRLDTATRIGWAGPAGNGLNLKPDVWQVVEFYTPCEGPEVVWFQPYFVLNGGPVFLDDLEIRAVAAAP